MIENPKAIDKSVEQLKRNGMMLKVSQSLQDYLLCVIRFSKYEKKAWLGQPFLIKNLEKKCSEQVMKAQSPKTMYSKIFNHKTY